MVDKDNGLVVQPGSAEALRGAIRAFLALPAETHAGMGAFSRARAESLTWQRVARMMLDMIEVRLAARRLRAGS